MRYAQLVIGPAGSGKSTYCSTMVKHGQVSNRVISCVNLDPAAEHFDYEPMADIRDLINLEDAMEDDELRFGPNGGLVFCMEYFMQNTDWLEEQLGEDDDDYILFDCPGQIELYTHLNVMRQLVDLLQNWSFHVCCVFVLEAQFMMAPSKFFSGALAALSAMVNLELPHVNVISKVDLINKGAKKKMDRFLMPSAQMLMEEEKKDRWGKKFHRLSKTIAKLVDDSDLVNFVPLDITDEESIENLLLLIDNAIQYGEDLDVKTRDFEERDVDKSEQADIDLTGDF